MVDIEINQEIDAIFNEGRENRASSEKKKLKRAATISGLELKLDRSIREFERLVDMDPTAENYRLLGEAYTKKLEFDRIADKEYMEMFRDAIGIFEDSLKIECGLDTYLSYLDLIMDKYKPSVFGRNFDTEALKLCYEALEEYPDSVEIYEKIYELGYRVGAERDIFQSVFHVVELKHDDIPYLLRTFGDDLWFYDSDGTADLHHPITTLFNHIEFRLDKHGQYEIFKYIESRSGKLPETNSSMVGLLWSIFRLDNYYMDVADKLLEYIKLEREEVGGNIKPKRLEYLQGMEQAVQTHLAEIHGDFPEVESGGTKRLPSGRILGYPSAKEIKRGLDGHVVGQEAAKIAVATAAHEHFRRLDLRAKGHEIDKSNIVMLGPTGVGKTYIAEVLAEILNVPFLVFDASSITEAGYIGSNMEDIPKRLIHLAGGNVVFAKKGIVYLDEIDKLRANHNSWGRDVSGKGAQQNLLMLIEGGNINMESTRGSNLTSFDTTNVLFICGGSFLGGGAGDSIWDIVKSEDKRRPVGFTPPKESERVDEMIRAEERRRMKVKPEHLIEFGLIPELVGRLPEVVTLDALTFNEMHDIFLKPKNALFKQMRTLFKSYGIDLNVSRQAAEVMVAEAMRRGMGARSLRSICNEVLAEARYELPDSGEKTYLITKKEAVEKLYYGKRTAREVDAMVEKAKTALSSDAMSPVSL